MFTNVKYKKEKGREKKSKSVAHIKGRKKEEEERVCFGISFLKDVTEKGAWLGDASSRTIHHQNPIAQPTDEREREREREKKGRRL